ncbi:MAG: hypothetical protein KDB00_24935 [Planctomycetales bacterium]|nr:hypothetical protein [Planctomycetales bacterium]
MAETLGARISGSGRSFKEIFDRDLDFVLREALAGVDRDFDDDLTGAVFFSKTDADLLDSLDFTVATAFAELPLDFTPFDLIPFDLGDLDFDAKDDAFDLR